MSRFLSFLLVFALAIPVLYLQIFSNFFFTSSFLKIFPTLILIFVVGSRGSSFRAIWLGAFIGVCLDSYNFTFSGYDTAVYATFGALSGLLSGDRVKIKIEGIQRLPIFIFLFNIFLFAKSLLVTPSSGDLLSWLIYSTKFYLLTMAPSNLPTILIFVIYYKIVRHER